MEDENKEKEEIQGLILVKPRKPKDPIHPSHQGISRENF
jgi:hypothetical protein